MSPSPAFHAGRRRALAERVAAPVLLLGVGERPRNLRLVPLPFRQDSTFLYFTGCAVPGAAMLLVDGEATLYLPEPDPDDALWTGRVEPIEETAARLGFERVRPARRLEEDCAPLRGRLLALASPDPERTALARRLSGLHLEWAARMGPEELVDAVVALRRRLAPEEVDEVRRAVAATAAGHAAVAAALRPGRVERELAALFEATCAAHGLGLAFPTIATRRGEVLHAVDRDGVLREGDLFLLDAGAESPAGYASDVTRVYPVSGRLDGRRRAVVEAVLAANRAALALVRPDVRFLDVHLAAARAIAAFLADEGLLRCAPDEAVEAGAHAPFFPHGVGHLLGLDAHDLEDFGDRATRDPRYPRSQRFGLRWLRIDLDLEPGMVVTVEPGLYFAPAILRHPAIREEFGRLVDFGRAERWIGLGGVRIEDDVLVTPGGHEVLTSGIPAEPDAVAAMVRGGPLVVPDP